MEVDPQTTPNVSVSIAVAILLVDGRYALQLRDDKPGISAPGMWGLFGGGLEADEEPRAGMLRELEEELAIRPSQCRFLWFSDGNNDFHKARVRHYVFEADVTDCWPRHQLLEGQAEGLFRFDELERATLHHRAFEFLARHHEERAKAT